MNLRKNTIIKKPWGREEIFAQAPRYVGKFIYINKGHRLSRQYHAVKEETISVLEGILELEIGPRTIGGKIETIILKKGETFHIPAGLIHRFCAVDTNVKVVEVSTTEIQDIVRLADDYSRIIDVPLEILQSDR